MLVKFICIGFFAWLVVEVIKVIQETKRLRILNKKVRAWDKLKAKKDFKILHVSKCGICGIDFDKPVEIYQGEKIICSSCNNKYKSIGSIF